MRYQWPEVEAGAAETSHAVDKLSHKSHHRIPSATHGLKLGRIASSRPPFFPGVRPFAAHPLFDASLCSNPGHRCLRSAAATTAVDRRLTVSSQGEGTVALPQLVATTSPGPDHLAGRIRVRLEDYQVIHTVARAAWRPRGPGAHGHDAGKLRTCLRQPFLPSVPSAPRELSSPGVALNLSIGLPASRP